VTADDVTPLVRQAIAVVVPEADVQALDPAVPIRDQLDMDSMDFINFVAALDELTHIAVPEADYGRLGTLESCEAYLREQLAHRGTTSGPPPPRDG
jgi:acyl carrier protein